MFSKMGLSKRMRKNPKLAGFLGVAFACVFFFICRNLSFHEPLSGPAVFVWCDEANILYIEIHNRSTEAVYLPFLRFSAEPGENVERSLPLCFFQMNANNKDNNESLLALPLDLRGEPWRPIYGLDKVQIIINTNPNSVSEVKIQLPEIPKGWEDVKIDPGSYFVEHANLSDYIGEGRSRGLLTLSYTLSIHYRTEFDRNKPAPNDPPEIDDRGIIDFWSRFLEFIGTKRTRKGMFFGDSLKKCEITGILRIE